MAGRIKITEDNILLMLTLGSLLLTATAAAVGALLLSPRFGASILAGGLLATANFLWLRRGLEAVFGLTPNAAAGVATLRYLLRLGVMALLLYVLIVHLGADIFGLLLGLSVLVLNIIVFSIYLSTRKGG